MGIVGKWVKLEKQLMFGMMGRQQVGMASLGCCFLSICSTPSNLSHHLNAVGTKLAVQWEKPTGSQAFSVKHTLHTKGMSFALAAEPTYESSGIASIL